MVIRQLVVTYNIIINQWVTLWSEVPWLFFWVVRSFFQTCQFVFKIYHIVSLLIPKGSIFVFGQNINVSIILSLPCLLFNVWIRINLSYRIVPSFLIFYMFWCNFYIWVSFTLKVGLLFHICMDFTFPFTVIFISWEKYLIWGSLCYLLILCWEKGHTFKN